MYILRVKDQGRTKDGIIVRALGRDKNLGTNQRTPKLKKVLLLRLPSLLLLLYLASSHREGVRRNALRVLHPKSPHSEEMMQYIEWRTPCGYAAVWLYRVVPYRVGTTTNYAIFWYYPKKCCFLRLRPNKVASIPKKVVSLPKKVDSFPEIVDLPVF